LLPRFLIIEDDAVGLGPGCMHMLREQGQCHSRRWDDLTPEVVSRTHPRLIIANVVPAAEGALRFFRSLQQSPIQVPVVAVLPESSGPELMRMVSEVTDDFLFQPVRGEELNLRISRILGPGEAMQENIRNRLVDELGLAQLVGNHPSFLKAVEHAVLFGASDAPVLITGETGTGKELFAHAIHSLGERRNKPFVPLDCGVLPDHLAENELFGHRRGAYTDAHDDQRGLAAMAESGTLFLDEIDALSPANQAKLLRFLEEGTYRSLGADRMTRSNIRIVAATNRPVEEAVRQKQFRGDLYFRLNVLRLHLPPLRERSGDVALLARHFLHNECCSSGVERRSFSASALNKLELYGWPGNVRELFNAVRRAFVCARGRQILPEEIILQNSDTPAEHSEMLMTASFRSAKQRVIESFERTYIEHLLERHEGNVTRAARDAGKERRALGRLVKKYGISVAAHGPN